MAPTIRNSNAQVFFLSACATIVSYFEKDEKGAVEKLGA